MAITIDQAASKRAIAMLDRLSNLSLGAGAATITYRRGHPQTVVHVYKKTLKGGDIFLVEARSKQGYSREYEITAVNAHDYEFTADLTSCRKVSYKDPDTEKVHAWA